MNYAKSLDWLISFQFDIDSINSSINIKINTHHCSSLSSVWQRSWASADPASPDPSSAWTCPLPFRRHSWKKNKKNKMQSLKIMAHCRHFPLIWTSEIQKIASVQAQSEMWIFLMDLMELNKVCFWEFLTASPGWLKLLQLREAPVQTRQGLWPALHCLHGTWHENGKCETVWKWEDR